MKKIHPPRNEKIASAFLQPGIMRSFMHQCAVHRAVVIRPLLLNVDKRPLSAAEFEVLNSG